MDFSHINFYALSTLINFFVSLFFGVFVYFQGGTNKVNKTFSLFMFFVAVYNLFLFLFFQSTSFEIAFVFARLGVAFATFVSISAFYFIVIFLNIWEKYKIFVKLGFVVFSFLALIAILPVDWLVKTIGPISVFNYFLRMGVLYPIFLVLWSGYFVAVFVLLIVYYRKADRIKKAQIRYILLGLTFGNIGGSCNWILAAGISIVPPYIVLSFLVFAFGYAILKHHLFNIRMFAVEVLTFSIWILLLVKILTSSQAGQPVLSDLGIFLSVVFIGSFLIRVGGREARQKEELAKLNSDLDNLNQNLEAKVAEQTKEIRHAYEVEKVAHEELEELDKAKTEFILASQHNLRTPLTITKGYVEEIENQARSLDNHDIQTSIDKTKSSLDILAQLVNGLIDVTDLKVGKEGFSEKE